MGETGPEGHYTVNH